MKRRLRDSIRRVSEPRVRDARCFESNLVAKTSEVDRAHRNLSVAVSRMKKFIDFDERM